MEKKYICYSGYVISKSDGDRHLITAYQVSRLYDVNPRKCYFVPIGKDHNKILCGLSQELKDSLIKLCPNNDGNYKIQKEKKQWQ